MPLLSSVPFEGQNDFRFELTIDTEMANKYDTVSLLEYDADAEFEVEDEACYTAVATP